MREPATIGQENEDGRFRPNLFTPGTQQACKIRSEVRNQGSSARRWIDNIPPWSAWKLASKPNIPEKESRAPGRARPAPDADVRRLEGEPQRELDNAWKIVLAGYLTKRCATATAAIRRTKLRVVEPVEELGAELDASLCSGPNFVFLKTAKSKFFIPSLRMFGSVRESVP